METLKSLTAQQKRFIAVVLVFALACGVALWAIIFASDQKKQDDNTFSVAAVDQKKVAELSKSFVHTAGTWGLKANQVNGINIGFIKDMVRSNNETTPQYWDSRATVYTKKIHDQFVVPNSPIDYPLSITSSWSDEFPQSTMQDFSVVGQVSATPVSQGYYIVEGETRVPIVSVNVKYTSRETSRVLKSDDASSNGDYFVLSKDFPTDAQLNFAKIGGQWKLYSNPHNSNPFTLATWKDQEDYTSSQFGMKRVGEIKHGQ